MQKVDGFRGSFSGHESNALFLNRGQRASFAEAGYVCGLAQRTDGRAVAAFDMDGDGWLDLAVLSLQGLRVYRNVAAKPNHNFIEIELHGRRGQTAVGSQVIVRTAASAMTSQLRTTAGFHTQVRQRLHFGLGAARRVAGLEVRWASGRTQRLGPLRANRRYRISEGRSKVDQIQVPPWVKAAIPAPPKAITGALGVLNSAGQAIRLAPTGRPAIVNIWAPWCAACVAEVAHLQAIHLEAGSWVNIRGLSLEIKDLDKNDGFIKAHGLTYPSAVATDAAVRAIFGPAGEVQLPTTLIFDAKGRLLRRFSRVVSAKDLESWLEVLRVGPTAHDYQSRSVEQLDARDGIAAMRSLQRAAELSPREVWRHISLAKVADQQGQIKVSLEAAGEATRLAPENEYAWHVLAGVLHRSQGASAARVALTKAPSTAPILRLRAEYALRAKDTDAARGFLEQALVLNPKDLAARKALESIPD